MEGRLILEGVHWVGAVDWDRRLFDSFIPLPDGTSYNSYLLSGSEKTVLLDTVDPSKADVLMSRLDGVKEIHYVVSHHAEQDHSGALPRVLEKYKNAKVLASPKGKELLLEHLDIPEERIMTVADGEVLQLGDKTIEFMHTPWVHWPETMSTYLRESKVLFTCDMFGSHLAFSDPFVTDESRVSEAAKRYYAEVMMPFRPTILKHIDRFEKLKVDIIAPSHGPVYKNPGWIMRSHREWASDKLKNVVTIPYATMHGSTERMVDYLTGALEKNGVVADRFNLAVTDMGKMLMSLVDSATLVVGSPTILTGAHPKVAEAAFIANALRPKVRFASIIGSYGWAGKMVEQITTALSGLKAEMLEGVVVKGKPGEKDMLAIERLASLIAAKHRENNIL